MATAFVVYKRCVGHLEVKTSSLITTKDGRSVKTLIGRHQSRLLDCLGLAVEHSPGVSVCSTDWERRATPSVSQAVPGDISNPCFPCKEQVMPILLWLLGVPLVVVVALYLLHVI